jgi:hypothetical protein
MDALKYLAWPAVVVVAMLLFGGEVMSQFSAGNVSRVKVGLLELDMRASALPQVVDPEVAEGLAGLPEPALVALIFSQGSGWISCSGEQDPDAFLAEAAESFDVLEARGLAVIERTRSAEDGICLDMSVTRSGAVAYGFMMDLLSAQLSAASAG